MCNGSAPANDERGFSSPAKQLFGEKHSYDTLHLDCCTNIMRSHILTCTIIMAGQLINYQLTD